MRGQIFIVNSREFCQGPAREGFPPQFQMDFPIQGPLRQAPEIQRTLDFHLFAHSHPIAVINDMASTHFDTHSYVKKLISAGFTEQQAEVQVQASTDLEYDHLAAKQDLRELEMRLTIRLGGIVTIGIGIVTVLVKIL